MGGARVGPAGASSDPTRERRAVGLRSQWGGRCREGDGACRLPYLVPPTPGIPTGHSKLLLMSSAKMMLVRRAGWDRRACTTAFWEHWASSAPSGSILATSGRVDDLGQKGQNLLSGATPGGIAGA